MSFSIKTDALDRQAREGEIVEAIDAAYGQVDDGDEARAEVDAAKHVVHFMLPALGADVASFKVSIRGSATGFSVGVDAVQRTEPEAVT